MRDSRLLLPDVFVPQVGLGCDEVAHHLDAAGIVAHVDGDASGAEQVFSSDEGAVLSDDDAGDPVEEDGAGAHVAR